MFIHVHVHILFSGVVTPLYGMPSTSGETPPGNGSYEEEPLYISDEKKLVAHLLAKYNKLGTMGRYLCYFPL